MRRSWLAVGLVGVLLFAIGVAIGRRSGGAASRSTFTVTKPSTGLPSDRSSSRPHATRQRPSAYARTQAGAAAAASTYLASLDGPTLLSPARLRRTISTIATSNGEDDLARAYARAGAQARLQLGVGTTPEPLVILRAAPVGYRLDRFSPRAAAVSVWRVGIVGSGATTEPQQTWRTETVSLSWEDGTWKVKALSSAPGPTPPLPASAITTPPGELFASVPQFEEFRHDLP